MRTRTSGTSRRRWLLDGSVDRPRVTTPKGDSNRSLSRWIRRGPAGISDEVSDLARSWSRAARCSSRVLRPWRCRAGPADQLAARPCRDGQGLTSEGWARGNQRSVRSSTSKSPQGDRRATAAYPLPVRRVRTGHPSGRSPIHAVALATHRARAGRLSSEGAAGTAGSARQPGQVWSRASRTACSRRVRIGPSHSQPQQAPRHILSAHALTGRDTGSADQPPGRSLGIPRWCRWGRCRRAATRAIA